MLKVHVKDLDRSYIYVSDGTWFSENSICFLETNISGSGPIYNDSAIMIGNTDTNKLDGELCQFSEFKIYTIKREEVEVIYD